MRTFLGAFSALAVLLLTPLVGACYNSNSWYTYSGDDDRKIVFYLEAKTATSDPFLSLDPEASAVNLYQPPETAPGSVPTAVTGPTGQKPRPIEFHLAGGAPNEMWFNMSKHATGNIYFRSTVALGGARAEIVTKDEAGKEIILGGDGFNLGTSKVWQFGMMFKPEQHQLKKGQPVFVRVYSTSGYADLQIGTGGTEQSRIELHYCDQDPLATGAYLNGTTRKFLVPPCSDPNSAPPPNPDAGSDGALIVAGLGLALAIPRAAPRRRLALLLAAAVIGAGCLGAKGGPSGSDVSETPQGTIATSYAPVPTLQDTGRGDVQGAVVQKDTGIPIPRAHISFLGTALFTDGDAHGRFRIGNVTAGEYAIRVDAKGFLSHDDTIRVQAGQVLDLRIEMAPEKVTTSGKRPHVHDDWLGETKKEIYKGPILVGGVLPDGAKVLPGTKLVTAVLQWTPAAGGPYEAELRISTISTTEICYPHRAPGVPYNIAIFPNDADPGHATVSRWTLNPTSVLPAGATITITIYKGVVPYESEHPDPWGGRDQIPLFGPLERGASTGAKRAAPGVGDDFPNSLVTWEPETSVLTKGVWAVPAGTKEVRGTFSWAHNTLEGTSVAQTEWKLGWKGADRAKVAAERVNTYNYAYAKLTPNGTHKMDFVIEPKAEQLDGLYSVVSLWQFAADDGKQPFPQTREAGAPKSDNTGYDTVFKLTAYAVRDPNWKDE